MVATPKDPHGSASRRWLILPDQLDRDGWRDRLAARTAACAGAVLVESREWLSRRPYHRQRVALILLNASMNMKNWPVLSEVDLRFDDI
jgi:deoxyribodipyrimidine photolyase-like uncharacterized protein